MKTTSLLFVLIVTLLTFFSCSDDDTPSNSYEVPTSYDFDNVNYNGQSQRLGMLQEMKDYMTSANTTGTSITANRLSAMYRNEKTLASWIGTYDDSKQLKNKTIQSERDNFEQLFVNIAQASQSMVAGSDGQAGVVKSTDGQKEYLLAANGIEYTQIIEKGLMGACFYYQATSVYMGDDRMNVDNEVVTPGEGTEMEHHWDEAFGYTGMPTTAPLVNTPTNFWGNYITDRETLLSTATGLMQAMVRGRAAISNNDISTRDEAIANARTQWELVSASTAVHYINSALNNQGDQARFSHALSEALAFVYSLKFNPERKMTLTEIDEVLVKLGGSSTFQMMNLYDVKEADLLDAKSILASTFDFEGVADQL